MQKILGFSAKISGGKNTSCNYLIGHSLLGLGVVRGAFTVDLQGRLGVSDLLGDTNAAGIFDITRKNETFDAFLEEFVNQSVRLYSVADLLKQTVAVKVLGLEWDQVYGNNTKKDEPTKFQWKNMPFVVVDSDNTIKGKIKQLLNDNKISVISAEQGERFLTVREILQVVGTNIFRRCYDSIWIDGLVRKIKEDNSDLALICDVRFPNEVEGIHAVGGKVIRLTRSVPNPNSEHPSENALNSDVYDWANFDAVIDNRHLSVAEQNEAVRKTLISWNWDKTECSDKNEE